MRFLYQNNYLITVFVICTIWIPTVTWAEENNISCPILPNMVQNKVHAIQTAVLAKDYTQLQNLAYLPSFQQSYGENITPVEFWQREEKKGINIFNIILTLLSMDCVMTKGPEGDDYIWPSAVEIPYTQLSLSQQQTLQKLYQHNLDYMYDNNKERGYYLGWFITINHDGRWVTMIKGKD
ncbi:MAG: hypothetical protein K1X44_06915 [Alphaproteobacteria bacterium]|nr:hypothetical protein [Alphaproteobacteria bacterium]